MAVPDELQILKGSEKLPQMVPMTTVSLHHTHTHTHTHTRRIIIFFFYT